MSFRKTSTKIKPVNLAGSSSATHARDGGVSKRVDEQTRLESNPSIRPSVLTSDKTISTGTPALDRLLRHGGLPLGSILLLEESGMTDFASAILRSFAATSISSGPYTPAAKVFVVGAPDPQWIQSLPAVTYTKKDDVGTSTIDSNAAEDNRMKIAWRYQEQFSAKNEKAPSADYRYCPVMDMTKRSALTQADRDRFVLVSPGTNLFSETLSKLRLYLADNVSSDIVKVVIPLLLHPASYTSEFSDPKLVLSFLNSLKELCARYSSRLAVIISMPLQLYPRDCGLIRWMELTCHGVVHLDPFQTNTDQALASKGHNNQTWNNNHHPQGLVHVYKLPILSQQGRMVTRVSEDAFRLGKSGIEIEPWAIPVEEYDEPQSALNHDF